MEVPPCSAPRPGTAKRTNTLNALGPTQPRLMPPPGSGAGLPGMRVSGLKVCSCEALSAAQDPQGGEAASGRHRRSVRSLRLRPAHSLLSG